MATQYSVDVSVLFLCVITRPFSHFDDDSLPCVTALSSELTMENREPGATKTSDVKKEGLCLHETTPICTYMCRHIHDCVQSSFMCTEVWRKMCCHTPKHAYTGESLFTMEVLTVQVSLLSLFGSFISLNTWLERDNEASCIDISSSYN